MSCPSTSRRGGVPGQMPVASGLTALLTPIRCWATAGTANPMPSISGASAVAHTGYRTIAILETSRKADRRTDQRPGGSICADRPTYETVRTWLSDRARRRKTADLSSAGRSAKLRSETTARSDIDHVGDDMGCHWFGLAVAGADPGRRRFFAARIGLSDAGGHRCAFRQSRGAPCRHPPSLELL